MTFCIMQGRPGETLNDLRLATSRGARPIDWSRFAFDRSFLSGVPKVPGTYRFYDADDNLLYVRCVPFHEDFKDESYLNNSIDEDMNRMKALPGVASVAHTFFLPWAGGGSSTTRKELGSEGELYRLQSYPTYGDIAATLGVRIVAGRNLDETDYQEETRNVLISQEYATLLFGDEPAVGRFLQGSDPEDPELDVPINDAEWARPFPFEADVDLAEVELNGELVDHLEERVLVGFRPNGSAEPARLLFSGPREAILVVDIDGETALARIERPEEE